MNFKNFADAIKAQFETLSQYDLFRINIDKDTIWQAYLAAYPKESNPIYLERTQHDCQACASFVKNIGNVVAIKDNKLVTVWDISVSEPEYQAVAKTMKQLIESLLIKDIFLHDTRIQLQPKTNQLLDDGSTITWDHLSCKVPKKFKPADIATQLGNAKSTRDVFARGLEELTLTSLRTVSDLISDKLLYRGDEFRTTIETALATKIQYDNATNKNLFTWQHYKSPTARIRNTAIGTLLINLSENMDLETAVKKYESVVAPSNYKRTSALITPGMIKQATETIAELGIEDSLHRRLAVTEDVSINNVIFADRSTAEHMKGSIGDLLASSTKKPSKGLSNTIDISIDEFVKDIIPNIDSMEMLLDNKYTGNLMTLVAPQEANAKPIFKWNNNFSWSYNGNITDSMKERVKTAGGKIDGVLRFSIQWNEENNDSNNDLDAHCASPTTHIYFSNKKCYITDGNLDIDITNPGSNTAVENITWPKLSRMKDGEYNFYVNNYNGRNTNGFRAEIEFNGEIHSFDYPRSVTSDVPVATVTLKNGQFTIKPYLKSSTASKQIWNLSTQSFVKVNMMMLSPNFWDGQTIGNKHHFFILDNCNNPDQVLGFYNEFLSNELTPHRKTMEILSSKMKCQPSESSLSGLGFSSTVKNEVVVKTKGSITRTYNIKF